MAVDHRSGSRPRSCPKAHRSRVTDQKGRTSAHYEWGTIDGVALSASYKFSLLARPVSQVVFAAETRRAARERGRPKTKTRGGRSRAGGMHAKQRVVSWNSNSSPVPATRRSRKSALDAVSRPIFRTRRSVSKPSLDEPFDRFRSVKQPALAAPTWGTYFSSPASTKRPSPPSGNSLDPGGFV